MSLVLLYPPSPLPCMAANTAAIIVVVAIVSLLLAMDFSLDLLHPIYVDSKVPCRWRRDRWESIERGGGIQEESVRSIKGKEQEEGLNATLSSINAS